MKFYVGFTDKTWFDNLAALQPDEVNFWRPGGEEGFRALAPGELFLFKLKKPDDFIVGGGFFTRFSILPASLAWDAFGKKNGRDSFAEFRAIINAYRKKKHKEELADPFIGCVVLTSPFFLAREQWIATPKNWSVHIVQGKLFQAQDPDGLAIYQQLQSVLQTKMVAAQLQSEVLEAARYGQPLLMRNRLGQGGFRVSLVEAYSRSCAMTGEKTLPVLTAAHIRPFAADGPHRVSNGLLLRSDLHMLFDAGLLGVSPEFQIEVSSRIKTNFGNGRHYYALHGQNLLVVPKADYDRPDRIFLEWHRRHVFQP